MAILIKSARMVSDTVATPPTNPTPLDCYKVPSSPQGAWAGVTVGNLVVWDEQTWVDIGALSAGDRVVVVPTTSVPSGTFALCGNQVGTWSGSAWTFTTPLNADVALVSSSSAPDSGNVYCFAANAWVPQNGLGRIAVGNLTKTAVVTFAPVEVGTTDATVTVVSGLTTTPALNTHTVFDACAQAIKSDGSVAATLRKSATFRRAGSTPVLVAFLDTGSVADSGASAWLLDFNLNGNAVETRVTGQAATNIAWSVSLNVSRRTV